MSKKNSTLMKASSKILKKVSTLIKLLVRVINKVVKRTANWT